MTNTALFLNKVWDGPHYAQPVERRLILLVIVYITDDLAPGLSTKDRAHWDRGLDPGPERQHARYYQEGPEGP